MKKINPPKDNKKMLPAVKLFLILTTLGLIVFTNHCFADRWAKLEFLYEKGSLPPSVQNGISDLGPAKATTYFTSELKKNVAEEITLEEVLDALEDLEDPQSASVLIKYGLTSSESHSRKSSVEILGIINSREAIPEMLKLLNDEEYFVEAVVYDAMARMKAVEAVPQLLSHGNKAFSEVIKGSAEDEDRAISSVYDICQILGVIGDKQAVPFLQKVMQTLVKKDENLNTAEMAALALGKIGDKTSGDLIAKLLPNEITALSLLKHPQALVRARKIVSEITDDNMYFENDDEVKLFNALQAIAENGTAADIKIIKEVYNKIKSATFKEVIIGHSYPRGDGTFYLMQESFPVYFGWALTVLGDSEGEQILDKALKGNDALAAAESARFYVQLKRTDKYDLIAKTLRKYFGRKEYESDSDELDRGWSARTDIMNILAQQQTPEALNLLVQTVNDDNINIVIVARRAIRTYPTSQSLPLLEKQLNAGGEWEKWQIATQMEFAGEEGLKVLYKIAKGSNDAATQAVALRAVVRAKMSGWKEMLCSAGQDKSEPMKELIEWMKNYFEGDDDKSILACVK